MRSHEEAFEEALSRKPKTYPCPFSSRTLIALFAQSFVAGIALTRWVWMGSLVDLIGGIFFTLMPLGASIAFILQWWIDRQEKRDEELRTTRSYEL